MIESITRMRLELLGTAFTSQHSDARIMDQMEFIGDQITAVSISISFFELFNKISRQ
jgi:hypothetical protein